MTEDSSNNNKSEIDNSKPKNDKPKKNKPKRGCLFSIFKFFIIIILILVVANISVAAFKTYKANKLQKDIREQIEADQAELYSVELAIKYEDLITPEDMEKDYDEDALTNAKELELGTDPLNLDTDADGIADGTEIEMYNTDPLKYSTPGDNTSDGAKVNAELNPLKKVSLITKIKNQMFPKTIEVEDSDIKIETSDLETMNNYIINKCQVSDLKESLLATPIKIHNVNGKVVIPLEEESSETTKVAYYNEYTGKYTEIKAKVKDNTVEVDVENENPLPIIVYNDLADDVKAEISELENDNNDYFIYKVNVKKTFLVWFTEDDSDVVIVIKKGSNLKGSELSSEDIKNYFNINEDVNFDYSEINSVIYGPVKSAFIFFADVINSFNPATEQLEEDTSMSDKDKNLIKQIEDYFHYITYSEYNGSFKEIAKTLQADTDVVENNEEVKVDDRESLFGRTYNVDTNFDIKKDAFSFKNFGVEEGQGSVGGNCAGMAAVSTCIYNNKSIPREYEYTYTPPGQEYKFKYNVNDVFFNPLFTKGNVYNYTMTAKKDGNIYNVEKIANEGNKDAQAINMVGLLWGKANDDLNIRKNKDSFLAVVGSGYASGSLFGKSTDIKAYANVLEERMNKDKVTYLTLSVSGRSHVVTAIGMETNSVDPNIVDVTVYDNNFADNESGGVNIAERLKVRLILTEKKVNILGLKSKKLNQKFLYNVKEPFEDNPYDYEDNNYDNIDVNASLFPYYTAIYDENYINFK
jgi:hypothetical protein